MNENRADGMLSPEELEPIIEKRTDELRRSSSPKEDIMINFPVLLGRNDRKRYEDCPRFILWEFIEPHRSQVLKNHSRSLERLVKLGGLLPDEIMAVIEDREWKPMIMRDAIDQLKQAVMLKEDVMNAKEGFNLMSYRCKAGHVEFIWNSRGGITPFMVNCRECGLISEHVDWHSDLYVPLHQPKKGDRIFIDLTLEKAKEYRREYVEKYWDDDMKKMFDTKEDAIQRLAKNDFERFAPHTPDLVTVT